MPNQHAVYVQAGKCTEACACAGLLEAEDCPEQPGCERCFLRVHVVGAQPPDSLMVIRVLPGETLRRVVERELGAEYASVGSSRWVN